MISQPSLTERPGRKHSHAHRHRGAEQQRMQPRPLEPASAPGTFGYVALNSFFGPHYFNADASLSKAFKVNERVSAQFRAEIFNAFNHVNLGQVNPRFQPEF